MANPNNITLYSVVERPLTITEADANFQEVVSLINEFNSYASSDPYTHFNDRNDWTPSTFYSVKDLVRYDDGTGTKVYICVIAHTSDDTDFESQYWALFQGNYIRQTSSLDSIKTIGGFYSNDIVMMLSPLEERKGSWVWKSDSTLVSNDLDVIAVDSIAVGRWIHEDLLNLTRDFININTIFGYKYTIDETTFNYYDYVDGVLGRIYDESATAEEIELFSKLDEILGTILGTI